MLRAYFLHVKDAWEYSETKRATHRVSVFKLGHASHWCVCYYPLESK